MVGDLTWEPDGGSWRGRRTRRRWNSPDGPQLPGHGLGSAPQGGIRTVSHGGQPAMPVQSLGGTYSPMLGADPQPRVSLWARTAPPPGIALVLHREGERLVELMPAEGTMSLGGILSDVKTVYRIDLSEHPLSFEFRLPSARAPHEFTALIDLTCAVRRPALVVERRLTDVRRTLQPALEETMREVSRTFAFDRSAGVEPAIREALRRQAAAGGFDPALTVRIDAVRVHLDPATSNHLRRVVEQEREISRSRPLHDLIERRDWSILALYLERNPGNVGDALTYLSQQHQLDVKTKIEALAFLLGHDVIEQGQLADAVEQSVLGRDIIDALGLSSPAQRRPRLPAQAGALEQPDPERPTPIRTVRPTEPEETQ